MVSKAREDLPEPESPVMTVSRSRGISTVTFLRLWTRAPRMIGRSSAITLELKASGAPGQRSPTVSKLLAVRRVRPYFGPPRFLSLIGGDGNRGDGRRLHRGAHNPGRPRTGPAVGTAVSGPTADRVRNHSTRGDIRVSVAGGGEGRGRGGGAAQDAHGSLGSAQGGG